MNKESEKENKKNIGKLVDRITTMISSRIVYGGSLVVLGIKIVITPSQAPSSISWGIGLAILLAAAGLLVVFFTKKSFNRENLVQILESIAFLILGVLMIIFSNSFGEILQEIVFVSLFVNSIANLFSLRSLNDIRRKLDEMAETRRTNKEKDEVLRTVSDAVRDDFVKYNTGLIDAAGKMKTRADASTWGQVIINVVIALVSLTLLVTHFIGIEPIYGMSGVVMIVSGLNEIFTVVRAFREKKRAERLAREGPVVPNKVRDVSKG